MKTDAWANAAKAKGVSPARTACAAYGKRVAAQPAPADLMAALLEKDAGKRDGMLLAFESRSELAGTVRAMRAELAPVECADAITDPSLSSTPSVSGTSGHALIGLSIASKLSRTASAAPVMKDASAKFDKEKVKRFIQGPLRLWMVEQATAIDLLSSAGVELTGIARGLVAIEAGMADLRLVDRIRSSPVPSTWDKDVVAVYEAALDEALEPRKTRGRDAALVGLADFASAGIVHDARIGRARALLSKLYGGRRIDALDALVLPQDEVPPALPQSVLALVRVDAASQAAFAKMNVPAPLTVRSPRARFEMGKNYWRRSDFVEAAHGAAKEKDADPSARLLLAVSLALAKGPNGAKEMMTASSPAALGLNHTEALDALVAEGGKLAGIAAYDAAYLRALSPPDGEAARAYQLDVAERFRKARALLQDPAQQRRAAERAADADALAKIASH